MERNLFRYIWSHTSREQIWIVFVTLLAMIPYYMSFDLPKQIINGPITGIGFEEPGATLNFLRMEFDLPFIGPTEIFSGFDLTRMPLLVALSCAFLALVIVNGLTKIYINTYKGRMGERLLRRIRFDLIDRILRFPPKRFKSLKAGEVASMVKDEVEPFGGFSGEAFASPVMLAGQTFTAMLFIFVQHVGLGLVALTMALIQVLIIPKLRARLIVLGRERQLTARQLAGRVTEIVEGIDTIRGTDATNYVRADVSERLGKIFKIRYDIFQWKFFVKFLNNFIAQLTPFIFYLFGGYLAIIGKLDVGQLVAVINAYKELPGPMKGLIDYDLARQDIQVKYETVVGQFDVEDLIEPEMQMVDANTNSISGKPLQVRSLNIVDDSGARTLERASARFESGEVVAFYAVNGTAAEDLANAIGRFVRPASGAIQLGGQDILQLPDSISGRRITYASPGEFFFSGTLEENILFGLKNAPRAGSLSARADDDSREWWRKEAELSGNPVLYVHETWIDEASILKHTGTADLDSSVQMLLRIVDMQEDLSQLALGCPLDPIRDKDLTQALLDLRHSNVTALKDYGAQGLILSFDINCYNDAATIAENLYFGKLIGETAGRTLGTHEFMRSIAIETGLAAELYSAGQKIAEYTLDILGDLPAEHPFLDRINLLDHSSFREYRDILDRTQGKSLNEINEDDRHRIMWLTVHYSEPRYRFGIVTEKLKSLIVSSRLRIRDELPEELSNLIEFYDWDRYMYHANIRENIVFGMPNPMILNVEDRLSEFGSDMRHKFSHIVDRVLGLGLKYEVGPAGRRLSAIQRAKLNVARALLRPSDVYVFNRPLVGLPISQQEQIMRSTLDFLKSREEPPLVIWVLSDKKHSTLFDRLLVFENTALRTDEKVETHRSDRVQTPGNTAP